jgi:hypothetical protein
MLRTDAEENSAPTHVLTLTSSRVAWTSKEYARACATFWQAFRRRYGHVEYCGFVEFTTGKGKRSGGHRRLHTHWLVKGLDQAVDVAEVQAWVSAEWSKLTGAWRVEFARLETVGGVVGYLALHHEKAEQRPPVGWTGRRLRPSKGYFAETGARRRARAGLWLAQYRAEKNAPEWGVAPIPGPPPRLVRRHRPHTEVEGVAASRVLVSPAPVGYFDSLPGRRELDRRLLSPDAPIHADPLEAAAEDHDALTKRHRYRERMQAIERRRSRDAAAVVSPGVTAGADDVRR